MPTIWLPLAAALASGDSYFTLAILIVAALILGVYLWGNSHHHKEGRAERLQKTYREMNSELLDNIPEEELVDAVIANLMGKLDKLHPDDYKTITVLSRGRRAVYGVWLICHEVKADGLLTYLRRPCGRFAELTADGLELIGAPESAAVLRTAKELELSDEEKVTQVQEQLITAIDKENPLELCRDYIRTNPSEFLDGGK